MDKKKRNIIEEVESINSRLANKSSYEFQTRLDKISRALIELKKENKSYKEELLKYIPIATISCFEGYFRSVVKELIDFGKPFNENIKKLNQANNIKLDFEIIAAIQTKTLSVGDFVAHILPFNNIDDIHSILSILLDRSFLTDLKEFKKNSIFDSVNKAAVEFENKNTEIIVSIKRMYEFRHILCHEFATKLVIDGDMISNDFNNCSLFLRHTQNFIREILRPNIPYAPKS